MDTHFNCTAFTDVPTEAWEPLVFGKWIEENGFDHDDFILPNHADVGLDGTVIVLNSVAAVLFEGFCVEVCP